MKLAYASAQGSDIEADQATPAGDVCIMLCLCCCLFISYILGTKDCKKMEAYELLVAFVYLTQLQSTYGRTYLTLTYAS